MKVFFSITFLLLLLPSYSQQKTNVDYYNDGMKYAQRGNYKEAIQFFNSAVKLKEDDYFSIHNRGICKSLMKNYSGAIEDFKKVLEYQPDYVQAHIALGNSYKKLTYYDTAVTYYTNVLKYEANNVKAYYFRGYTYEAMMLVDEAAADFKKALELGATQLEKQVKYYSDTTKSYPKQWYVVSKIKEVSTDPNYGFTKKNPIKVGTSKEGGGYANVLEYLGQLKDEKKQPVKFEKVKSCCPHKAPGFQGNVLLEEYKITYDTRAEGTKTATIYLSYYEYEAPKILMGLKPTYR